MGKAKCEKLDLDTNEAKEKKIDSILREVLASIYTRPLLFLSTRLVDLMNQLNKLDHVLRGLDIVGRITFDLYEDIKSNIKSKYFNDYNKRTRGKLNKGKEYNIKNILDHVTESRITVNIYERQSLEVLADLGILLTSLRLEFKNDEFTKDDILRYRTLKHFLIMQSCEALGYWTAKFEMAKQNKNNVKTRTTKKEERKAMLKEWMQTMKAKEYRLKAMQKWDVSERTVLNYEQEIKGEKTAIMRKKDDTA